MLTDKYFTKEFEKMDGTQIEPEILLMAMLSRPQLTQQHKMKIHLLLDAGVNIEIFCQLFPRHRVWPCVYTNIRDHFSDRFPLHLIDNLHIHYIRNIERNNILLKTLFTLLQGFKRASIPVVTVKGIFLAQSLYGDIAKRHSKDIDLLIYPVDLVRANEVLNSMGFRCEIADKLPAYLLLKLLSRQKDLEYVNAAGVILELHFRLYDVSTLFSATFSELLFSNSQHSVLNKHEAFLYLCCHGMNTFFHRLKWLCDLAIMIDKMDYDWDKMYATARRLDCHRTLTTALVLSHLIYATELPHQADKFYSKDWICRWSVKHAIKTISSDMVSSTTYVNCMLTYILLPTFWNSKLGGVIFLCKPNYDDLKLLSLLPKKLGIVCYLIRPASFLWRRIQYALK